MINRRAMGIFAGVIYITSQLFAVGSITGTVTYEGKIPKLKKTLHHIHDHHRFQVIIL